MDSKEDNKEIIVTSSSINEFNEMLNDFKTQFEQMTEKFKKINDCNIYTLTKIDFNDNFLSKVNNSEFDLNEREKEYKIL